MNINDAGLEIIKRNEGCELNAYFDVVGIPTIGYGHTANVSMGMTVTQEEADEMLKDDLDLFEQGVEKAIGESAVTENQFSAMVSLSYNIGLTAFRRSTVLRKHLEEDYEAAANAFLMWNKAGGRVFTGLTRRRHEERQLYLT